VAATSGQSTGGRSKGAGSKDRIDYATLTAEQARVLDAVVEGGESVFFTGAAGCGKSFLLKAIVQKLAEVGRRDTTFVTGTTGIAACNVGGFVAFGAHAQL
jgi:ATP-dependent DNA helicase PIF1